MHNSARDQADGLRRLLGREGLRVVRLNSARRGVGKTGCAVNLAAALAEHGREVLIIDENSDAGNVADNLAQPAHRDFQRVLRGECGFDAAIRQAGKFSLLTLAGGMEGLLRMPAIDRDRLAAAMAAASRPYDVVIIDTVAGAASRLLPLAVQAQEDVLVVTGSVASITDAYAFVKGASAEFGKRRYRVLMTRVRNEQQARALFTNMADVARRYLGLELTLMAMLPADDRIKRAAALGAPVLKAFPDSPAASAFRQVGLGIAELPRSVDGTGDMAGFLHGLVRCGSAGLQRRAEAQAVTRSTPVRSRTLAGAMA